MKRVYLGAVTFIFASAGIALGASSGTYTQTNLTSDLPGIAANQDPNLVNPWGLVAGGQGATGTPFWTSDNGTGLSTIYDGTGAPKSLVVTIPAAPGQSGPSNPTGIVFNGTSDFKGSPFIFATESGTIAGWAGGTNGVIAQTGAAGSIYKGLGIGNNGSNLLYAANFGLGRIDVFDSTFAATSVSGGFKDPTLPTGYSPFNIQNIGGQLYVTYAATSGGSDEIDGAGLGYVDVFDMNGVFVKRLASQGALNAPWGVALAPSQFGALSGDLLVGNFGDGTINGYDPNTGAWEGAIDGTDGKPLSIDGLWGLSFGNDAFGQSSDTLYFNAGIAGPDNVEDHGLFGAINPTPEPGALPLSLIGLAVVGVGSLRRVLKHKSS